ncbi:MAG: ATP-binding protein, partial [Peptostreptococcaceae bacterium]
TDYSKVFDDAGMSNLNIHDIYVDNEGVVWTAAGVEYGLISFNKKSNEIKNYNNFAQDNSGYNTKYYNIISINSDDEDNIWIGTNSGLMKLNKRSGEYTKYTEKDGLPNNFIYGVLFDEDGNLWLSTNYGISKFNEDEDRFINYDSTDGIQGNEFNEFSYYKNKDGELFFGGTNGLTSFNPQDIREKNFITSVEIESIYSNCGDIKVEDKINLDYKNNLLQFEFFMPDFRDTKKLIYAYKLTGLDTNWIISDEVKSVSYSNLKPGRYVFEVAARNSSGEWSEPTSIRISIEKPPWKTPFAYFVYSSLVIMVLYIIWNRVKILDRLVKQRTAELNNKLEENKELYSKLLKHEKYKNNYFINLSHELRTPLNIISATQNLIQNLNDKNRNISKEKMSYYMQTINRNSIRLINLIDNIMDTSKIESGSYKLNIKEHDIVYLVEEVALSMKELAYDKGIELIIEPYIEEKIIECDAIEIERVIINLISNAIKFTDKGGTIEVFIWEIEDGVKITVKDNGIGVANKNHHAIFDRFSQAYSETSEEYGGSGLGLTLSKQLIELHGGAIWVESELGNGSEFIIILPLKPNKGNEVYIC